MHLVFGQVHEAMLTHHQKLNQSRTRSYHQPHLIIDGGVASFLRFSYLNYFQNPTPAIATAHTMITFPTIMITCSACMLVPKFVRGRLVLQFSVSNIFGSYIRPLGVGCKAHKHRQKRGKHARPTPSHSKKKSSSIHLCYVGGGRVPSSTGSVIV